MCGEVRARLRCVPVGGSPSALLAPREKPFVRFPNALQRLALGHLAARDVADQRLAERDVVVGGFEPAREQALTTRLRLLRRHPLRLGRHDILLTACMPYTVTDRAARDPGRVQRI